MGEVTTPKKRGGQREGSGRPKKDPETKAVKVKITMTPEHYAATEGDRSGMIRRAFDGEKYWRTRCELAEAYIDAVPCDPDVYAEQFKAYTNWQDFKNQPSGAKEIEK